MSTPDEILRGLDPEQRRAATALHGPVCILAGAGTGKTRAITHRIAYGVASGVFDPHRTLALTFTARAAAEMRTRLRDLGVAGVQARTFHSAALRQLQYFWPQAVGGPMPSLIENKVRLLTEVAQRMRMTVDRAGLRDLAGEIEWAKVSLHAPEGYAEAAKEREMPAGWTATTVARLYTGYEEAKTARNMIDFEDVLLILVGILSTEPQIAATIRDQYRVFVVDEYQDVSPLQHRLLDLWLGDRGDLCVVGDASQTIYSFTGATSRFLTDFRERYPAATVVRLVRDYRSSPQIVEAANRLLADRTKAGERDRTMPRWPDPLELVSQRPAGPDLVFAECTDDEAEAGWVADRIAALIDDGVPASEIAVLFRTNGQSQAFETALSSAGIGYQLRGGERFFSRREVRDGILQLRAAARAAQDLTGDDVTDRVRDVLSSLGYSAEPPAAPTPSERPAERVRVAGTAGPGADPHPARASRHPIGPQHAGGRSGPQRVHGQHGGPQRREPVHLSPVRRRAGRRRGTGDARRVRGPSAQRAPAHPGGAPRSDRDRSRPHRDRQQRVVGGEGLRGQVRVEHGPHRHRRLPHEHRHRAVVRVEAQPGGHIAQPARERTRPGPTEVPGQQAGPQVRGVDGPRIPQGQAQRPGPRQRVGDRRAHRVEARHMDVRRRGPRPRLQR